MTIMHYFLFLFLCFCFLCMCVCVPFIKFYSHLLKIFTEAKEKDKYNGSRDR